MPDVLTFAIDDKFIFRIFQHPVLDENLSWSNTYEFKARASGTIQDLEDILDKLFSFHTKMSDANTVTYRGTVSTWVPDSHPYNPESFFTKEYPPTIGLRNNVTPLPPRVTLQLKRDTVVGRPGKLFMRGFLDEVDVEYGPEGYSLKDAPAIASEVAGYITSAGLAEIFAGGGGKLQLVLIGQPKDSNIVYIVDVQALVVRGVTDVQLTHRWYNRKTVVP